jgi:hypothetical protein
MCRQCFREKSAAIGFVKVCIRLDYVVGMVMRGLGEEWKRKQTRIDLENTKGTRFRWKRNGSLTLEVREKDIHLGSLACIRDQ